MREYRPRFSAGLRAIRHRGPDSSSELADERVYLGHNRLSIIDLSTDANQPFKSTVDEAWIIYNGEIYNFDELRKTLDPSRFRTRSDTEVLLEGYLAEGVGFFEKLRGIYAFAILDRRAAPQIILARDPAGIKPLYYARRADVVVFGSEIKALLPVVGRELTIDEAVVKAYLNLGYCPEPFTAYREIRALRPGHAVVVTQDDWRETAAVGYRFEDENDLSYQDNVQRASSLLAQAVHRNLVADVPTAVALSGGIDSSLVYAHATRANDQIRGLTVRFNEPGFDESSIAESYARQLGGEQLVLPVDPDFGLEKLNDILLHFDQPFADSSAVPVYYLTRATRQYTKVLIGGDGGDELFNGYASLSRLPAAYRAHQSGFAKVLSRLMVLSGGMLQPDSARALDRAASVVAAEPGDMLFDWLSWLPRHTRIDGRSPFLYAEDEGARLYRQAFGDRVPRRFTARLTFEHFAGLLLSDYLRKTDMMSMLNGVEYRVPLLDEDLVRFAFSIPYGQKSSSRKPKRVLRDLHARIFPPETSTAAKRGFSIPLDKYLSADDFGAMRDLVMRPDSFVQLFIDRRYLDFVFDAVTGHNVSRRYISSAGAYQRALLFYSLELWYQHAREPRPVHAGDHSATTDVPPLEESIAVGARNPS
jgi:asparagine synthase (glutamine-hydrolysing)